MPNPLDRSGTMRSTRKMREESQDRYRKRKAELARKRKREEAAKRAVTAPKRKRRTATAASTTPTPTPRPSSKYANTESGPPGTKGAPTPGARPGPTPKARPTRKGGRVVPTKRRHNIRALRSTGGTRRKEMQQALRDYAARRKMGRR
jgi:hypothetical protein